ncbi:hypothetical protein KIPB_013117, partial [Kipferlia bialata]
AIVQWISNNEPVDALVHTVTENGVHCRVGQVDLFVDRSNLGSYSYDPSRGCYVCQDEELRPQSTIRIRIIGACRKTGVATMVGDGLGQVK